MCLRLLMALVSFFIYLGGLASPIAYSSVMYDARKGEFRTGGHSIDNIPRDGNKEPILTREL